LSKVKGKRVGKKKSDRRWRDPDGKVWASRFEWTVYDTLSRLGCNVRKCTERDSISYSEPKPNVKCMECGSLQCMQERIYTPDLFLIPKGRGNGDGYFIETKGYFARDKRILFRCFRNDRQDIDLRLILESDHWTTKGKTRLSQYAERYLPNTPCHVWNGDIPDDWK